MKKQWKSMLAGLIACLMLVMLVPVGAFAAEGNYSVRVQNGTITFLRDAKVIGSYAAANTDLILTADSKTGELLLQFPNKKGTYTNVTLGMQRDIEIEGTLNSLTLKAALPDDVSVTIVPSAKIATLAVYSRSAVGISGKVTLAEIYGAATIENYADGEVSRMRLRSAGAVLAATGKVLALEMVSGALASGDGVDKITSITGGGSNWARSGSGLQVEKDLSSSGTAVRNGFTIKTSTIYANDGDLLIDLEGALNNAVRVYTSNNARVYGESYWNADSYTEVTASRSYSFTFVPDNARYNYVEYQVRVIVESDRTTSSNKRGLYFETTEIRVASQTGLRLRDLQRELESAVQAYSKSDDDRISGEIKWNNPSTLVRTGGSYTFTFTPDESRYRKTNGRIRVYVDK